MEKKKADDRPVVLFDARAGRYYVPEDVRGAVDLVVFHPPAGQSGGRPAWLRMGGYRNEVKVADLPTAPREGSLLVQAVPRGEDEATAIPVDQVEYWGAEAAVAVAARRVPGARGGHGGQGNPRGSGHGGVSAARAGYTCEFAL